MLNEQTAMFTEPAVDSPDDSRLGRNEQTLAHRLTPMETAPVDMTGNVVRAAEPLRGAQIPLVVLYDGDCGLCNNFVRWLVQLDSRRQFFFAPKDGETADRVRAFHDSMPANIDSVVLVDRRGPHETVHWYSDAVFKIFTELPYPYRLLTLAKIFPPVLADVGYRVFSSIRGFLVRRRKAAYFDLDLADYTRFLP